MFRTIILSIGIAFHDFGVWLMARGFGLKRQTPSMRPPAPTMPDPDSEDSRDTIRNLRTWN